MNENQLTPMESLKKKVTTRIRESIADLIPEEAFSSMVEEEIENFRKNAIPKLVKEALEQDFKQRIQMLLSKPEFQQKWTGTEYEAGKAVEDIIRKLAPDFTTAIFSSVVDQAVMNMRQQMSSQY